MVNAEIGTKNTICLLVKKGGLMASRRGKKGRRKLVCLRCDWEWYPRIEKPKCCPQCMSPYWNTPRKKPKPLK